MSEQNYQVKIGSQADTSGLDKAAAATDQLGQKLDTAGGKSAASGAKVTQSANQAANALKRTGDEGAKAGNQIARWLSKADQAAKDFVSSLKMGVGIDIGGKIVNSIAAIPGILSDALQEGLAFNANMQNAEIGIANVLAKFQNLDSVAAKNAAAGAMAKIVEIEPKAAGGLGDLVEGFLATVAAAQSAGIAVEDNVELVGKFANALANANIPANQLAQEMRSILTGNINADSSLAKVLQIKNEDITRAKEAGNLLEFLNEKIGALGEAGDSPAVAFSSLASAVQTALGKITAPIFAEIVAAAKRLNESLSDPKSADGLKNIGFELAELVKTGAAAVEFAVRHANTLAMLAKGAGLFAAALAAIKITQLTAGLTNWVKKLVLSKAAMDADTAATVRNTASQTANAAARKANGSASIGQRVAGSRAAGVAGATSLGIGLIGYEAASSWAADKNRRTAESDALGDELQKQGAANAEMIKGLASQEEKQNAIKQIMEQITALQKQKKDLTGDDLEMADRFESIYRRQIDSIGKISDAYLAQKMSAREAAEEQRRIAEDAEKVAKLMEDFSQGQKQRNRSLQLEEMVNNADKAGGINVISAELQKVNAAIAEAMQAAAHGTVATEVAAAQKEVDRLQAEQKTLRTALASAEEVAAEKKKAAAEDQKKLEIDALNEQLEIAEAIAAKRLASLEASKKTEEEIAGERFRIEEELLQKKRAIEDQRAGLQGETAAGREARALGYETASIQNSARLSGALKADRDQLTGGAADPERRGQRASNLRLIAGGQSYTRDGVTYDRLGRQIGDEAAAKASRDSFRRQADGSLGESSLDGSRLDSAPVKQSADAVVGKAQEIRDVSKTGFDSIASEMASLGQTQASGLAAVQNTLAQIVKEQKVINKKLENLSNNV